MKFTEADMDWQYAHGVASAELAKAKAEIERLRAALEAVVRDVNDYERVNNLAPNPGRTECWDSVAQAKEVLRVCR